MVKYWLYILLGFILLNVRAMAYDQPQSGYEDPDTAHVVYKIESSNLPLLRVETEPNWKNPNLIKLSDLIVGSDLWFRIPISFSEWKNPAFFIKGFFRNMEIYLNTEKIFDTKDMLRHRGSPAAYVIPLTSIYRGQYLYLKIHIITLYPLGEIQELKFGSANKLLELKEERDFEVYREAMISSIIGGIIFFIGVFSLFVFAVRYSLRLYNFLLFGLICLCAGFDYLTHPVELGDLLYLRYEWIELANIVALFILLPVFIGFIEMLFGSGWKKLLRRLWQISALYALVFLSVLFIDLKSIAYFPTINYTFAGIIVLILLIIFISGYYNKKSSRPVIYALVIFMVCSLNDLLQESFNLPFKFSLYGWGVLVLVFALAHQLLLYYVDVQDKYKLAKEEVMVKTLELANLQEENLRSQYEALKSQVNPHFLFNTFSTLISVIEEDQILAVQFVQEISNVYRYVLSSRDKQLICLFSELEFVKSYSFLLKKRFHQGFDCSINISETFYTYYVAPLSVQMLIENVIKHNILSSKKPLNAEIYIEESENYLVVKNNLQRKNTIADSTKLGLKNIINRYEYFTNRKVIVEENESYFIVKIPLLNQEEANEICNN